MPVKYIFFDYDGTIADTMPYTLKNLYKMLDEEGIRLTKKQIVSDFKSYSFHELFKKWNLPILRLPIILNKINKIQDNLYDEIQTVKIFSGMEKLFIDLKKRDYKLGILSSNLQKNVDKFIEINKLNYFDIVYCDPSFLNKDQSIKRMLKTSHIKPENMTYVGDEIRDIIACHKLGIKIICVSWGLHTVEILKKNGADYIVEKSSEIIKILTD